MKSPKLLNDQELWQTYELYRETLSRGVIDELYLERLTQELYERERELAWDE